MNLPLSYINTLYMIAKERLESEKGKEEAAMSEIEDELEDVM